MLDNTTMTFYTTAAPTNGAILVLAIILSAISGCGMVANAFMLWAIFTLRREGRMMGASGITLTQQAAVDFTICGVSIEYNWNRIAWVIPGVPWLSAFLCTAWHTMFLFWFLYTLSIFNYVTLSTERLIIVYWPLNALFLNTKIYRFIVIVVWLTISISITVPWLWYTAYDPTAVICNAATLNDSTLWLRYYGLGGTVIICVMPLAFIAILNVATIWRLQRNLGLQVASGRDLKRRASLQLIRTSICLGVLFFFTATFSQVNYSVQNATGVIQNNGNLSNIFALKLQALPFSCSPIICFIFLPGMRHRVIKRLKCSCRLMQTSVERVEVDRYQF